MSLRIYPVILELVRRLAPVIRVLRSGSSALGRAPVEPSEDKSRLDEKRGPACASPRRSAPGKLQLQKSHSALLSEALVLVTSAPFVTRRYRLVPRFWR